MAKLKGISFWEIDEEKGNSCTWRALLDLRNRVRHLSFVLLGNVVRFNGVFLWKSSIVPNQGDASLFSQCHASI